MVGKDRRRNIVLIVKRVGNEENHVENAVVAELAANVAVTTFLLDVVAAEMVKKLDIVVIVAAQTESCLIHQRNPVPDLIYVILEVNHIHIQKFIHIIWLLVS